jgi:hypothetical protein
LNNNTKFLPTIASLEPIQAVALLSFELLQLSSSAEIQFFVVRQYLRCYEPIEIYVLFHSSKLEIRKAAACHIQAVDVGRISAPFSTKSLSRLR